MDWLQSGFHGEMSYMIDRAVAYQSPQSVMDGAISIVMLSLNYKVAQPKPTYPGFGRIARYALSSTDYHDTIHNRLKSIRNAVTGVYKECVIRGVVDTAPLLERDFARLSGLGWFGKNTMLINKSRGSYFFLAALLVNQKMSYDEPFMSAHCGTCTACLTACPTDAFAEPGVLDSRRCISYLTIEHRGPIPVDLRDGIGDWFFGCDVCQEVCPWNTKPEETNDAKLQINSSFDPIDLKQLFDLSEDQFRAKYRKTPMWRAKRRGVLRNAAIVLGNQRDESAIVVLSRGLTDQEELVRGACAWALGKIGSQQAIDVLKSHLSLESDDEVINEILEAIKINQS